MVLLSNALDSGGCKLRFEPARVKVCEAMETTPSTVSERESQVFGAVEMVEVVAQGYASAPMPDPLVVLPNHTPEKR